MADSNQTPAKPEPSPVLVQRSAPAEGSDASKTSSNDDYVFTDWALI